MATHTDLSLPLALLVAVFGVSQAFGSHGCCIKYTDNKIHLQVIDRYSWQKSSGVCDIDAAVFEVRISPCSPTATIKICADPTEKWVQDRMKAVDKRTKRSQRKMLKKLQNKCKILRKLLV